MRQFLKFWNVDASTMAHYYPNFNTWLNEKDSSTGKPLNAELIDGSTNYRILRTRNRNYPNISGLNVENFFIINDLQLMYINGVCYDCNNLGVSDVKFSSDITSSSFDPTTGILTLPQSYITGVQGIQGSAGSQGLQGRTGEGTQGIQGASGKDGVQGLQGSGGTDGVQGIQGTKGDKGDRGNPVYQTANPLSIQGVNGIYYDFDGSQKTVITGIYTLQEEIQNLKIPDSTNYVAGKAVSIDTINDSTKQIDVSLKKDEPYLDTSGGLNTKGLSNVIDDISTKVTNIMNNGGDMQSVIGQSTDQWNNADPEKGKQTIWAVKNYVDTSIEGLDGIEQTSESGSTDVVIDASENNGRVTQLKTLFSDLKIAGYDVLPADNDALQIKDGDSLNQLLKKIEYSITWGDYE